jgi:hypothetical protein
VRLAATLLSAAALALPGEARPASHAYSVAASFGAGAETKTFALEEPAGVILLYRLSAPAGTEVAATVQWLHVTVPLRIATDSPGACSTAAGRTTCTVGEEWCPMNATTWRVRIEKRAGPPGEIRLWFRVGTPPGPA